MLISLIIYATKNSKYLVNYKGDPIGIEAAGKNKIDTDATITPIVKMSSREIAIWIVS